MRRTVVFMICCVVIANACFAADDKAGNARILAEAEARLKAVYDKREFAPATFSGKWLRDSSGYLVLEKQKDGSEVELVQYEVTSGKHSTLIGGDKLVLPGTSDRLSIQEFVESPGPRS